MSEYVKEMQLQRMNPEEIIAGFCETVGINFEEVLAARAKTTSVEETRSDWLTRKEAAAYAKVSTDTIDDWCAQGYIEKSKLGGGKAGTVLISRESLEKHIRSCVVKHPKRVRKDLAPSVKGGYRA